MNTKEIATESLMKFINSDQRCVLLTGTHQYEKHPLVIQCINKSYENAKILFRINALSNITGKSFLGKYIHKQPKAGVFIRLDHNYYTFDSFTNRGTWGKVGNVDMAIIYPIDAIARESVKFECIDDLFQDRDTKKIFLISWTDSSKSYKLFDKYVDTRIVFDAEEDDPAYHKRVLDLDKTLG